MLETHIVQVLRYGAVHIFFKDPADICLGKMKYEFVGAGHFRVFFQVMLPQVMPTVTALFVSEFITRWNDSMTPLVYFPNLPTLASGLYVYQTIASRAINYPMLFAALVMCMIPVLVLYIVFQDTLMDLQLGGGVKG